MNRVNCETLKCRLQGGPARVKTAANNRKLGNDEDQAFNEWILDLAAREYPSCVWCLCRL